MPRGFVGSVGMAPTALYPRNGPAEVVVETLEMRVPSGLKAVTLPGTGVVRRLPEASVATLLAQARPRPSMMTDSGPL